MAAPLDPATVEAARQRWVAGEPASAIATAVGRPVGTLYFWRHRYGWPTRAPVAALRHPLDVESTLRLARLLWDQGVPRIDIANLCEVGLSTLSVWRRKYAWPARPVGRSQLAHWDRMYRQHEGGVRSDPVMPMPDRRRALKEYMARIRRREAEVMPWRCCDRLLRVPVCPTCERKNPRCA